jgi:hypothetical protein
MWFAKMVVAVALTAVLLVAGTLSGAPVAGARAAHKNQHQLKCGKAKKHRHQKKCLRSADKKPTPKPKSQDPAGGATTPSGNTTSPSSGQRVEPEPCHGEVVTLHSSPEASSGPEELSGGIYYAGGPAPPPGSCDTDVQAVSHAVTITVRSQGNHEVVTKETVANGEGFAIPLQPGAYEVESTECQVGGPVAFTVTQGYTTQYDFICPIS